MLKKSFATLGFLGLVGGTVAHSIDGTVTFVNPLTQPQLKYNWGKSGSGMSSGRVIEPYDIHWVTAYKDEDKVFNRDNEKKPTVREIFLQSGSFVEFLSKIKPYYPELYKELQNRCSHNVNEESDNFSELDAASRAKQIFDDINDKYNLDNVARKLQKEEADLAKSLELFGSSSEGDDTNSETSGYPTTTSNGPVYALIVGAAVLATWVISRVAGWFGGSGSKKAENDVQVHSEVKDVECRDMFSSVVRGFLFR